MKTDPPSPKTWEEKYYMLRCMDIRLSWGIQEAEARKNEKLWSLTVDYFKNLADDGRSTN